MRTFRLAAQMGLVIWLILTWDVTSQAADLPQDKPAVAKNWPGEGAEHYGEVLHVVPIGNFTAQVISPKDSGGGLPWVLAPQIYRREDAKFAAVAETQLALVKAGFHVVAASPGSALGAPDPERRGDAVYKEMTQKFGLSKEVTLMGQGIEGIGIFRWATENPGKVNALYLHKAVGDIKSWPGGKRGKSKGEPNLWRDLMKAYGFTSEAEAMAYDQNPVDLAEKLAESRPLIVYVTGGRDEVVPYADNALPIERVFARKGLNFRLLRTQEEGNESPSTQHVRRVVQLIGSNTYTMEPTLKAVPYGPHFKQVLDFWKVESAKPTPVVLYVHGGGWTGGSRRDVYGLKGYLDNGISYISIDYRFLAQAKEGGLEPPVKAPMHDAARALQFVRSKAAEWNIDPNRIGLLGGSAGACTILWLAFHADLADPENPDPILRQSTRPYCVAAAFAQTSLDPEQMREWIPNITYGPHVYGRPYEEFVTNRAALLPWISEFSPYALARADAPPIYLRYSDRPDMGKTQKDPVHSANFGVKLQERLRELKVPCELSYPGAPDSKHTHAAAYLIEALTNKPSPVAE